MCAQVKRTSWEVLHEVPVSRSNSFWVFSHGKGFGANSCFGVLWANRFHLRKGSVEGSPTLLYTSLHLSPMCIHVLALRFSALSKVFAQTDMFVFWDCLGRMAGASEKVLWRVPPKQFFSTFASQFLAVLSPKGLLLQKRFLGSVVYICLPVFYGCLGQRAVAAEEVLRRVPSTVL